MNPNTRALVAAARFHALAATASRHGGLWVSAGGGSANVAAGIISRATGVSFDQAHEALDQIGNDGHTTDWYDRLGYENLRLEPDEARWDVRTVARAACRF
jgi:hypothetical protein